MKLKKQLIVIVVCSLILNFGLIFLPLTTSSPSQDPREVQVTASGTWTQSHGPYYIENNITIPFGNTLNIEPGVVVYFNGDHSIYVEGTLNALGNATSKILFDRNITNPSVTNWSSLQFNNTGKGILDHCDINNGGWAVNLDGASGIVIKNSIINGSYTGIKMYDNSNDHQIINCTLKCNMYGIRISTSDNISVILSSISNNFVLGINCDLGTNITIDRCNISFNGGIMDAGITMVSSTFVNISNSNIFSNNGHGISIYQSSYNYISDCELFNNDDIGVFISQSSFCNVFNSEIYYNSGGVAISGSNNCSVFYCELYNHSKGVVIDGGSSNNHLAGNELYLNNQGIAVLFSYNNLIETSNVTDSYVCGIRIGHSDYNTISQVNIEDTDEYGLEIFRSNYNNISNCNFSFNGLSGIEIFDHSGYNNISGCNFLHDLAYYSTKGIEIYEGSDNNQISNCYFKGYWKAVRLQDVEFNFVKDSEFDQNDVGVELDDGADYNTLERLILKNHYMSGIELHSSDYNNIIDCEVSHNYQGIYLMNSKYNDIRDSVVENNDIYGIAIIWSRDNTIVNTNIKFCNNTGLTFSNSNSNEVLNCNISYNNNYGVICYYSAYNLILYSDIYYNDAGIYLYDSSSVDIWNSAITTYFSSDYDFYFKEDYGDGGETASSVTAVNTTFNRDKVHFDYADDSHLFVNWFLNIKVVDPLNNPLGNIPIYIWNQYEGYEDRRLYFSETDGWIRSIVCEDYIRYQSYQTNYNPYTISGSIPDVGTSEKEIVMDHTQDLIFVMSPTDIVPTDIVLSTNYPLVNEWVFINASIYNSHNEPLSNIDVKFIIFNEYFDIYSTTENLDEIGAFSTETASITFNFTQAGEYTLEVIVDPYNLIEESNESNNVLVKTITVYLKPLAVLEVSSTITGINVPVYFYGNKSTSDTGTIITYIFDFGDGSPKYQSPSFVADHTYTTKGLYRATLKVLDENGKESDEASVFIDVKRSVLPNQKPLANFTITPAWGYVNTSFRFESTSTALDENGFIDSYYWRFGDNQTANWISGWHTYTDDRVYIVSLVVWDEDSDQSDYCNKTLRLRNLAPIANLTLSKYTVNITEAIEFDASGTIDLDDSLEELSSRFYWDFGDGEDPYSEDPANYIDGAYDKKTIYSYSSAGTYNVTLTVFDDDGAMNQTQVVVRVNGPRTSSSTGEGTTDSWFSGNTVWAVVIISFIVAIVLAVFMLVLYRKKRTGGKPTSPKARTSIPKGDLTETEMYGGSEAYDSAVYPELVDGIKPKELEIGAHDELSPTAISPVRHRKKGKKKRKSQQPPEDSEEPEFKENDEEVEWDMESAVPEELEAKETATTIEYPEPEPSEVEWEPTTEGEAPEGLETVTEPEASDTAPVRLSTMPAVSARAKASCRWCEREISGKYIKGRRKKDPKTGDEFYVEGPFCSMKCSEEFIK